MADYMYTLDRCITYNGQEYKIIEELTSGNLLAVKKEDFDNNKFPIQTYIVPEVQ